MKQKILFIAAFAFGLLAAYLTHEQLKSIENKYKKRTKKVMLIEVVEDLPEGATITRDSIAMKEVDRLVGQDTGEILWKDREFYVIKKKVNRTLAPGTILRISDLKDERSKAHGLAGLVKSGYRAISISVDSTSSVTGLVKPGDRVDIIGTFRFPEMKGDKSLDVLTLTILQSVRIIACGKNMGNRNYLSRQTRTKGYNTVTLELSPKEVEMIIFAAQKGRLVLSLRSFTETGFQDRLESVNFRYLEEHINDFNKKRKQRSGL